MVSGCWKSWVRSPSAAGPIMVVGATSVMVVNGGQWRTRCRLNRSRDEGNRNREEKREASERRDVNESPRRDARTQET